MAIFSSFFDRLMSLYNEKVDVSYDVSTPYDGEFYALNMKCKYPAKGPRHIVMIVGKFNDYYRQDNDTVYLTVWTQNTETAIAAATACHEVGHAIAHKSGISGTGKEEEREASRLALEYLRTVLDDEQFAVAERFLNTMLKSHKSLI